MSSASPVPKSFGLTYDPPSITVVYALNEKLRACKPHSPPCDCAGRHTLCASFCAGKRTMPVRELHVGSDPDELARGITAAHPALLGPQAVSHQQARPPSGLWPCLGPPQPACFAPGGHLAHAESLPPLIRCYG